MRRIIAPILFITAFLTLIVLGTWQVQRLAWKNNIIQNLNDSYTNAEENLSFATIQTPNDTGIYYGSVQGRFIYDKEILVGPKPNEGDIGYQVITPLKMRDGNYILVNRGWINGDKKENLQSTRPQGKITVGGLFRKPDWNSFTPDNSPENNIWTKLDITQIATAKNITPIAHLMLYADKTSKPFGELRMQQEKWYPNNKHRQYAIFWYVMAGALVVVFGLFLKTKKKI